MFDVFVTCKPEELLYNTEGVFPTLKTKEEAEKLLRILLKRVCELSESQEKELHKDGRKIRKKFNMKPIKG